MDNNEILLKTLQKENELMKKNHKEKYCELEEKYKQSEQENRKLLAEKNAIKEQLDSILNSRSYKLIQKVKKILRR